MTDANTSLDGRSILVTGGTGSFGRHFVNTVLTRFNPRRLVVFSRDEMKQFDMQQRWSEEEYPCLRYFLGDVRDRDRLMRACDGIEIIVHAAAMKQIPAAERNPIECIATNVLGTENVISAAIDNNVQRVVALSTDKAANPINLYGATKLCADKLVVAANNLSGKHQTRFAVVRYGNVVGSRGSVIPYFKNLVAQGHTKLPLTDERMTRFFITLDHGVNLVLDTIENLYGGEIVIPKLPSVRMADIVRYLVPDSSPEIVGIRPGEKLHEVMIPLEESRNCADMGDRYIIQPSHHWWNVEKFFKAVRKMGTPVEDTFEYASNTNDWWLVGDELGALIDAVAPN